MPKKKYIYIYIWLKKLIYVGSCLRQQKVYLSVLSIYIFSFIVCGEQQTFIYKELKSP